MRGTRSRVLLSLITALAAALLAAPPAQADRYEESDPAGDMAMAPSKPAPAHRNLDLRHVRVRHTEHFVLVRAVMAALTRPRGDEEFDLRGFVKVNRQALPGEGLGWSWEVEFDKQRPRVGDRLFILDAGYQELYGCSGFGNRGLTARANYDKDHVTVIIPRNCLEEQGGRRVLPEWVQVSVTSQNSRNNYRRQFFDHLGEPSREAWPILQNSHFTPRLYPG